MHKRRSRRRHPRRRRAKRPAPDAAQDAPATSAPSETERQEAETPAAPPVGEQQPVESGVPEGNASDALPTGGSSDSQDSSSNKPDASPESTVPTCTVSISCAAILENLDRLNAEKADLIPADGVLLAPTAVEFTEGESIFDVLKRVCRENKIHMEFSRNAGLPVRLHRGHRQPLRVRLRRGLGLDVPRERRISQLRLLALYPRGRRHRRVGLHLRLRRGCRRRARRMKHHAFLACHPAVNLLYFVLVLTFSMFFLHPLCLAVSLCAALWCAAQLNGGTAVRRTALWLAPDGTARRAGEPRLQPSGRDHSGLSPLGQPSDAGVHRLRLCRPRRCSPPWCCGFPAGTR